MSHCANDPAPATEVVWLDDTGSGRAAQRAERVLSIANVAKMFGVSKLILRYYEVRGLIRRRHRLDGVRTYSWADCERIAFIIKCRKAGVKLGDIVAVIDATDDEASPFAFTKGRRICMVLVDRLERNRRVIDEALAELSHLHALLTTKMLGDPVPETKFSRAKSEVKPQSRPSPND